MTTLRSASAFVLFRLAHALNALMAGLSAIGITVALLILTLDGTLGVGVALAIWFFGTPLIATALYWATMIVVLPMIGVAKLLDREVTDWLIERMPKEAC